MNEIHLDWIVDENLVQEVKNTIETERGRILAEPKQFDPSMIDPAYTDYLGDSAFAPMMVIAIVLGIGALIRIISNVRLAHKYPGGELIDIRGGKLIRLSIPSIEKGSLVIIAEDGPHYYAPPKREEALTFLTKALGGMTSG